MRPTTPRFPVYIPSKSRADIATTPHVLDRLGVPFRLVVEDAQHDDYAAVFGAHRLLVLDDQHRAEYDTCLPDLDPDASKGSGPARNFIWDHAASEGHAWHWIMDDNIRLFARLHLNQRHPVADGLIFAAMEDFVLRYRNIAMAGPQYWMFAPSREPKANPFSLNTRIFSCNLIRNDVPLRWRCRYNEDLDLSIRCLRAGWCTVLFNAFLQWKEPTQQMRGGNTEAFYAAEGTAAKSEMIVRLHPDVCRLARRYGRDHHHADFSRWKDRPLIRRDDVDVDPARYASKLIAAPPPALTALRCGYADGRRASPTSRSSPVDPAPTPSGAGRASVTLAGDRLRLRPLDDPRPEPPG